MRKANIWAQMNHKQRAAMVAILCRHAGNLDEILWEAHIGVSASRLKSAAEYPLLKKTWADIKQGCYGHFFQKDLYTCLGSHVVMVWKKSEFFTPHQVEYRGPQQR